ncbi:MAG: hypothetical protein NTV22_09245 [bacterium]|nr:hypothetical protein [bacterium]
MEQTAFSCWLQNTKMLIADCGFSFAPLLLVNFFCSTTNHDAALHSQLDNRRHLRHLRIKSGAALSADREIGVPGAAAAARRRNCPQITQMQCRISKLNKPTMSNVVNEVWSRPQFVGCRTQKC